MNGYGMYPSNSQPMQPGYASYPQYNYGYYPGYPYSGSGYPSYYPQPEKNETLTNDYPMSPFGGYNNLNSDGSNQGYPIDNNSTDLAGSDDESNNQ